MGRGISIIVSNFVAAAPACGVRNAACDLRAEHGYEVAFEPWAVAKPFPVPGRRMGQREDAPGEEIAKTPDGFAHGATGALGEVVGDGARTHEQSQL